MTARYYEALYEMEDKKKNSPKTLLIIFGLVSSLLFAIMIIGWIMAAGRS